MFRLQRLAGSVVLAVALMLAAASTALADKRVALVLGVSNYQSVARLANPDNDAAAISDVFKRRVSISWSCAAISASSRCGGQCAILLRLPRIPTWPWSTTPVTA